jgi:hypothetical protein
MALQYSLLAAALLVLPIAIARPADSPALDLLDLETPLTGAASSQPDPLDNPRLYLILAEAADDDEDDEAEEPGAIGGNVEKRSAEEADDLEAAAGTNVLRPLFVYRQQLAYRERVKKGAIKRFGFRPRF